MYNKVAAYIALTSHASCILNPIIPIVPLHLCLNMTGRGNVHSGMYPLHEPRIAMQEYEQAVRNCANSLT